MADDRSITGSAAQEDDVHDDDELAEVLAAELERYATGTVPTVSRASGPQPTIRAVPAEPPMQPLAVPRLEPQGSAEEPPPAQESAFARRAGEAHRAMREVAPDRADSFRRPERPPGRRSATGPVPQQNVLPTADDLPVKRRTGFRAPPTAPEPPRIDPLDRVLPTGPVSLQEPTASLLESMISDATGPITVDTGQHARHAAPPPAPEVRPVPLAEATPPAAAAALPTGLYEDWEQSLRAIGRPRLAWEQDDDLVPTGGNPDLATVAIPVLGHGPVPPAPVEPAPAADVESAHRGAHALRVEPPVEPPIVPAETAPRRPRSGRRAAAVPADTKPTQAADPLPAPAIDPALAQWASEPIEPMFADWAMEPEDAFASADALLRRGDVDDEGIDEVVVDYPEISAATTGAIDLPQVEPRPRTGPLFIERVRTALLQLPSVPPSPTGSGAAAIVGRWFGAFASPLTLVLAFGLAAAGAGPAAAVLVLAGALLAVPALLRTTAWSARAADDAAMHETAVLGRAAGRGMATVLLIARIGAAATVLLVAGATAGAWVDRTGALGLGSSTAALAGSAVVAALALLVAALPMRVTAVLTLVVAVLGSVGTLLIALVLAPTGAAPVATTASGVVAAAVGGFAGVGLLLVLCGADVARWRTDLANPVSTAVGTVVAALCGAVLVAAGTVIASRLSGSGSPVDEFAGALSDASASLLAAPMLVILLVAAVTLPALLLRSSGAAAARLLGAGRPVRLGTVAAALLALAGALGLLAAGVDPLGAALAVAAILGVPVAAWAGLLWTTSGAVRPLSAAVGLGVAVVVGWALSDGLVPGAASPVLTALAVPASTGLRGGPAVGLVAALLIGVVAGALGGSRARTAVRPVAGPADTVEG